MAKLITETVDISNLTLIKEGFDGDNKPKTLKISGPFMEANKKNANERIYPSDELNPAVEKFIKETVEPGRGLMELEHSDEVVINPERACARILKLTQDGDTWIGESVILATDKEHGIMGTPKGDLVASLLNYGTALGVSSRAIGNVNESDGMVSDLNIVTLDIVTNPSIQEFCTSNGNRFVKGILESKQFMVDVHGSIVEKAYEGLEKKLSKMPNTFITEKKAEYAGLAVCRFLDDIVRI